MSNIVEVKFMKKKFQSKFGSRGPKSVSKLGFSPISQVWFISFLWNWYNDSLQQCLACTRGKIQGKILFGHKFGPNGQKSALKLGFLQFSQVWFISFPWYCIHDSLQQCLTCSTNKIHEKNLGDPNLFQGSKIGPQTRFFAIISSLVHYFSLKLYTMIACNNVYHVVGVKCMEKFGPKLPKLVSKLGFLRFSQVWLISFSWKYMQWNLAIMSSI